MELVIDFETANPAANSACSIGLLAVENGAIVDQMTRLIRPPSDWFTFTPIHGLTWDDVRDAPTFGELWRETLHSWFREADTLVAHNIGFDAKVLKACAQTYEIELPELKTECTVRLSRNQLGIQPANLKNVAQTLGIPLQHHQALSDARAAAYIYIYARTGAKPWLGLG